MRRLGLLCLLAATAWARDLDRRLLAASEPERVAAVRVQDPRGLLAKLDRFLAPFSIEANVLFKFAAPGLLRSAGASTLELAWPLSAVLTAPPASGVRLAYTAGSTDPEAFLAGLGSSLPPPAGLRAYRSPEGIDLFAFEDGGELLVSERQELAALARISDAPSPRERSDADLELELWPARLLGLFPEKLELLKGDFYAQLEGLYGQPGISPKEMRTFYEMLFLITEALGRQVEVLRLDLSLDGGDLVLSFELEPIHGGALDRFIEAQAQVSEAPLTYVPKEAVGAINLSVQSTPELIEALLILYDPMSLGPIDATPPEAADTDLPPPRMADATPTPTIQEMRERLRPLYASFYSRLGPQVGVVLLPMLPDRKGVRTVTTFGWKPPLTAADFTSQLKSLIDAALPNLQNFYRQLGWAYDLWLAKSPIPEMPPDTFQLEMRYAGLSPEQKAIFDTLYGGPQMRVFLNFAGGVGIAVTGPDSAELLKEWLRRAAEPPKSATGSKRILAGFLDLQEYLRLTLATMPEAQVLRAKTAVEAYLTTPQKLFLEGSVDSGRLNFRIRYPLEATLNAYREERALRKLR